MKLLKRTIAVMLALIVLMLFQHANSEDYLAVPERNVVIDEPWDVQEIVVLTEEELLQQDLIAKINTVVWSDTISEAIVVWCMNHSDDYMLCMKHVFWVANAESTLFTNVWKKNNAFGITERQCRNLNAMDTACRYGLKKYTSVEESVIDFIKHYEKNKWYSRTRGQDRLNGNYCTSQCSNRIPAFNSWMKKFESAVE